MRLRFITSGFWMALLLLLMLSGCDKEPMEIPEPDLSHDWKKQIYANERTVDESGYLPCSPFPMLLNPGHEDNYELRFATENFISKLQFQKGEASSFMVYVRHVPELIDEFGTWYLRGEVVLLDMRTGETTELGETTGRPSIGGLYVVFPNRSEIMVYDIRSLEYQTIDGAIYENKTWSSPS